MLVVDNALSFLAALIAVLLAIARWDNLRLGCGSEPLGSTLWYSLAGG